MLYRRPLAAERAADIERHHAYAVPRNPQDLTCKQIAHRMRRLNVAIKRVAVIAPIVDRERAARLHELRMHSRDDVAALHAMPCARETGLGRGAITQFVYVRDVVRAF